MKDRSDLSRIYPSVSGRTDNKSYQKPIKIYNLEYKLTFTAIFYLAVFLTLPIAMAVILLNFYSGLHVDQSNVYYMLPVMILPFALWGALLILTFIKTINKLEGQDANKTLFLAFFSLCSLSITKLLYDGFGVFSDFWVGSLVFSLALLLINCVIVFWVLWLMSNRKMDESRKLALLIGSTLVCLAAMLFSA